MIPKDFITNVVLHPASINKTFFHFSEIVYCGCIKRPGGVSGPTSTSS
jgi:hypothetical protein